MAALTMFGEDRQQEWMDKGVNTENFYDEAAIYGMIKMIYGNDAGKPAFDAIDRAKELVLCS